MVFLPLQKWDSPTKQKRSGKRQKIAAKYVYSRLIAFDMTVDKDRKVVHVETNTSDIGMEGIQYVNGPMFHQFTDEVIDYCKEKLKSTSFYKLHEN